MTWKHRKKLRCVWTKRDVCHTVPCPWQQCFLSHSSLHAVDQKYSNQMKMKHPNLVWLLDTLSLLRSEFFFGIKPQPLVNFLCKWVLAQDFVILFNDSPVSLHLEGKRALVIHMPASMAACRSSEHNILFLDRGQTLKSILITQTRRGDAHDGVDQLPLRGYGIWMKSTFSPTDNLQLVSSAS